MTVNIGKTAETKEDSDIKLTFARSRRVGRSDPIQNQWVPLQVLSSPEMATRVRYQCNQPTTTKNFFRLSGADKRQQSMHMKSSIVIDEQNKSIKN